MSRCSFCAEVGSVLCSFLQVLPSLSSSVLFVLSFSVFLLFLFSSCLLSPFKIAELVNTHSLITCLASPFILLDVAGN